MIAPEGATMKLCEPSPRWGFVATVAFMPPELIPDERTGGEGYGGGG